MCLITEQKEPIITKRDLTVYKLVRYNLSESQYIYAPFNFFRYELGKLYQTKITFGDHTEPSFDEITDKKYGDMHERRNLRNHNLISVAKGFHAATKIKRLCPTSFRITKCTIPKGSEIYKDKTNLIVSNQIIINEIL